MNVGAYVARSATAFADRVAIHDNGRTLTFRQLEDRTNRLAHALIAVGAASRDRVALALPNGIEWVEADFAIAKMGAMTIPLGLRLHELEMARALALSKPTLIITDAVTLPKLAGALPPDVRLVVLGATPAMAEALDYETLIAAAPATPICVDVDEAHDGRVMRFTSGSTGQPKGVFLTHRNWLAIAQSMLLDRYGLQRDDIMLACGPYPHAGGLWVLPALIRGAALQVMDRFDPEQLVRHIETGGATVVQIVPTALRRVLDLPGLTARKLDGLRCITYSGAPIDATTLSDALTLWRGKLVQSFGMNEACSIAVLPAQDHPAHIDRAAWRQPMGRETTLCEMRLAGPDGNTVPNGEVGEIAIRGAMVFREYWCDPAATEAVFRDGWFFTGDLAVREADGLLYLAGRSKDVIITGGFNVSPIEVETVLDRHPAVRQSAVIGLPHREWGEQLTAFVVLKQDHHATPTELAAFCRRHLTGYKTPKIIHLLEALPLNANGKIARRTLRDNYAATVQ